MIHKDGKRTTWYNNRIINDPTQDIFNADYWANQKKIVGRASGRGTTWFVQLEQIQGALRHYFRGGFFGKIVKDSYFFLGWDKTRSAREFKLLLMLKTAGVNVPEPIAARAVRYYFTYKADIISERIVNAQDLVDLLQGSALDSELYAEIGREIAKMHSVGVNHTDLNIHNILIDKSRKVWIIDFDKCSLARGEVYKKSNLARLQRSFEKEALRANIHWESKDFNYVLDGYKKYIEEVT
ncbi:3-deoxy-D-manno-octulosonic acid kinase [Vibrio coralliirubri]|uniref:3-deoxy-D-manno-octulosonic acid kinase n=1 Tax=Vibrio coralliirubri TaxID=1516159 RepID=UPI002FE11CCC